jgi:hypothetical protein
MMFFYFLKIIFEINMLKQFKIYKKIYIFIKKLNFIITRDFHHISKWTRAYDFLLVIFMFGLD